MAVEWAVGTYSGFFEHGADESGARQAAEDAGGVLHSRTVSEWLDVEDFGGDEEDDDTP